MNRLVVVGAGRLGSAVVRHALTATDDPLVLFAHSCPDEFADNKRVNFHKGRLGDSTFRHVVDDGDWLVCCHGPASPRLPIAEFGGVLRASVDAAIDVVESLADRSEVRMVLFSSGGAVYGPSASPIPEERQLSPRTPYAAVKAAEEMAMRASASSSNPTRVTALRCSTVYGTIGDVAREQGLVGAATRRLRSGKPVTIFGDGEARRGYIHESDVAASALAVLRKDHLDFDTYNLCSGNYYSTIEVVRLVADALGVAPEIERSDRQDADVLIDPARLFAEFPELQAAPSLEERIKAEVAGLGASLS